jgi:hypothetical protein
VYQQTISRGTPGCIMLLVARSDSMRSRWAGSGLSLAQAAAAAVNRILLELCVMSSKEQGGALRGYFHVGIYGYGLCPGSGREGVESALPGPVAGRGLVTLPELAAHPIAVREEQLPAAAPGRPARVPVWIDPYAGFGAPMCEAIATVGAHLHDWATAFPSSFPPIVINISDGLVTDSPYLGADLRTWARRLTSIQTSDGPALLFHSVLSPTPDTSVLFPATDDHLPPPGRRLFSVSSPLPRDMVESADQARIPVQPGARGFAINHSLTVLVRFLQVATRFDVRDRGGG